MDYPKGGYAFADAQMQHTTKWGYEQQFGMTLRDWFAGQWVAAGHHSNLPDNEAAEQAYAFADAMIEARQ